MYYCKMMARVSVPFTEGHYYGRGERPNTELADNSLSISINDANLFLLISSNELYHTLLYRNTVSTFNKLE